MFYASTAGIETAAPISLMSSGYAISAILLVVTLIAVSFAPVKRAAILTDKRMKVAIGALLPVGSSLLISGSLTSSLALLAAGGVLTGIMSGFLSLQWVIAYRRIGLRVAANSFPMLMAMAVGICATLMYLPQTVLLAVTIVFPIISELMFHEVRKYPWPVFEDEEAYVKDRPINFILMLLPFAVYAFASGFLDFSSSDNGYTFIFYALGTFVSVAAAGAYVFVTEREHFLSVFLVPFAVLVAVCVPFLARQSLTPLSSFISIGELGIEVLIFIVPIGFAQFFSIDALKTFALGRTAYALFNAIGWYAADFANRAYTQLFHSQISLVVIFIGIEVLAVGLIVAIVKAQKSLPLDQPLDSEETSAPGAEMGDTESVEQTVGQAFDLNESAEALLQASSTDANVAVPEQQLFDSATESLCESYKLSQRERDVFVLLAKGYTSPRIQKELYIAAGTVNYHARNIYAKLGVHSKQELIEMVEQEKLQG